MAASPKPLLAFNGQGIPAVLRASKRWAPWKAVWSEKRGKYDKIPVRADQPEYNLSTANPARWFDFDTALAAHNAAQGITAGVGYVMTKPHGIVGVDLDGCLDAEGKPEAWAQEIIDMLRGYVERSPSGNGLRIFVRGAIPADWANHTVGVECYAGHKPRFLTVTGRRLPDSPGDVPEAPEGALEWLAEKYQDKSAPKSGVDLPPIPLLLPAEDLPNWRELGLPSFAEAVLSEGFTTQSDRSATLAGVARALLTAGLNEVQALSLLVDNNHTFEVALEHRNQDMDRAMVYLWQHHVLAAKQRIAQRAVLSVTDLADLAEDDMGEATAQQGAEVPQAAGAVPVEGEAVGSVSDFADLVEAGGAAPDQAAQKKPDNPFTPIPVATYARTRGHLDWFVYGVLPRAEISAVIGDSGSGKTFFVLDVVMCVAAGMQWRGKKTKPGRVVYVAAEGAQGIKARVDAWSRHHGVPLESVDLHIIGAAPSLLNPEDVKLLVKALRKLGRIDLLVIDTLAQVTPGAAENSSEDMGRALAHCKTLHSAINATVLLVGHTGKDQSKGFRGWSGIRAALDALIEVTRTETYRGATITKLKDGKGEGDEYLFNLDVVELDYDFEWDEPITSCVVVPLEGKEAAKAKKGSAVRGEWEVLVMGVAEDKWGLSGTPFKEGPFIEACVAAGSDKPRPRDNVVRAFRKLCEKGLLVCEGGMVAVP